MTIRCVQFPTGENVRVFEFLLPAVGFRLFRL